MLAGEDELLPVAHEHDLVLIWTNLVLIWSDLARWCDLARRDLARCDLARWTSHTELSGLPLAPCFVNGAAATAPREHLRNQRRNQRQSEVIREVISASHEHLPDEA